MCRERRVRRGGSEIARRRVALLSSQMVECIVDKERGKNDKDLFSSARIVRKGMSERIAVAKEIYSAP
jgi:hypothetical protein